MTVIIWIPQLPVDSIPIEVTEIYEHMMSLLTSQCVSILDQPDWLHCKQENTQALNIMTYQQDACIKSLKTMKLYAH